MKNWYAVASLTGVLLFAAACSDSPTAVATKGTAPTVRAAAGVSGASFTSTNVAEDGPGHCRNGQGDVDAVNCNIYDGKPYVWIEGGPLAASLSNGTYFFAVLVPGGQNNDVNDFQGPRNLSDDFDAYSARTFTVTDGVISYSGPHDFSNGRIRLAPYATTTNPGGEYDVAVCRYDPATYDPVTRPVIASTCKYDNFKVREGEVANFGALNVDKFYDANGNGIRDSGEPPIAGWPMTLNEIFPAVDATLSTPASWSLLDPGTYSVTEGVPVQAAQWYISYKGGPSGLLADNLLSSPTLLSTASASTRTIPGITVAANVGEARLFGNFCKFQGVGARTIGYWKTHQAATTALLPVNLGDNGAGGTRFPVITWTAAYNTLNDASSVDAMVMLKAQLLGALLNEKADPAFGAAQVLGGTLTVSQLINQAQAFVYTNGNLVLKSGSALRTQALWLKDAMEGINQSNEGGSLVVINPTACSPLTFGSPTN